MAREYGLKDEIFPGTELLEALGRKDLIKAVAWLADARRIELTEEAWEAMKERSDRSVWAPGF